MRTFSGTRLRQQREAAGKRRESVAIEVDRSYASIIAYESGRAAPPAKIVGALADSFGCPVDAFYDEIAA